MNTVLPHAKEDTMKRTVALILALAMLFSISACKKSGDNEGNNDVQILAEAAVGNGGNAVYYTAEALIDSNNDTGYLRLVSPADDGVYAFFSDVTEEGNYLYRLRFIDVDGNIEEMSADWLNGGVPVSMCTCVDGGIWVVRTLASDDRDTPFEYELGRLSKEGYSPVIGTEFPSGFSVKEICSAGSRIFIGFYDSNSSNVLAVYNADGTKEYSIDIKAPYYRLVSDGDKLYMLELSSDSIAEQKFILYSFNSDNHNKEELFSFTRGDLLACNGDKVYISDSTTLYTYDISSKSIEQVLQWASFGLVGTGTSLYHAKDGSLIAWNNEIGIKIFSQVEGNTDNVGRKQQVVLAVNSPNYQSGSVLAFNSSNTDYEIIIKNYDGYPDPQTMLATEMISGNGPDIIDIMTFSGEILNPNAMVDLLPLIESDPDLSIDDFFEQPLKQMMTDDGRLPAIAPSFCIHSLLYKTGAIETGEFKSVVDKLNTMGPQEAALGGKMTKDFFLLFAFACGGVDKYTSYDVAAILEYTSELPEVEDYSTFLDRFNSGKIKFDYESIGSAWDLFGIMTNMYGTLDYEDISAFGFPFRTGAGTIVPLSYFAIPANAKCPDGSWEFLKTILTYGGNTEPLMNEFPLWKQAYEFTRANANQRISNREIKASIVRNGKVEEITLENADFFKMTDQLLAGVNGIYTNDQALYNIVRDSAAPYFNGDKSIDDAANEIMSRLEIYFAEKS